MHKFKRMAQSQYECVRVSLPITVFTASGEMVGKAGDWFVYNPETMEPMVMDDEKFQRHFKPSGKKAKDYLVATAPAAEE